MHRKERPLIRPRDISSLSRSVNANLESLLDRSRMTPVGDNRLNIEDEGRIEYATDGFEGFAFLP